MVRLAWLELDEREGTDPLTREAAQKAFSESDEKMLIKA